MRERKGSGFGKRSVASESRQAIKKYFLLYEGSDTEVQDLKERDTGTISFKTLFDKIIDYFHEKQIIINSKVLKRAIWETMKQICEKEFCEDLEGLKDSIGSKIGLLIEDMRK